MLKYGLYFSLALAAFPAWAQETDRQDKQDERAIVVEGQRDDPPRRENEKRPKDRYTPGNNGDVVGPANDAGGGPGFGESQIDWQRLGLDRKFATNSVEERYGHAGYMANCAIVSAGRNAAAYVATDSDTDAPKVVAAFRSNHPHCVNSAARAAPAIMVNWALAEILVTRFVPEPPLRAQAVDGELADQFIGSAEAGGALAQLGRCVVVFAPGYSYDLLFTKPASKSEKLALERVYRAAPECGISAPPNEIHSIYQRTSVAMALFRWYGLSGEGWNGGEGRP